MNLEEAFRLENQPHLTEQNERKKFLENMLQVGWFQYRAKMLGEAGIRERVEKIRQISPEQEERINKASLEELQEMVIEDMINGTKEGGYGKYMVSSIFLIFFSSERIA